MYANTPIQSDGDVLYEICGCRAYSNKARNLVTKLSSVGVVGFGRYALCDVCAVRCALCFLFCVL